MEAAKQRVARNQNRAAKNDIQVEDSLFEGTTSIKDKGVRGEKVALKSKKRAPYSKYKALCSDRGRRWQGNEYLTQSQQRAASVSSKFGSNEQHTSSNV